MMNSFFIKRSEISSQVEEVSPLSLDEGTFSQLLSLQDLSSLDRIGIKKIGQIFTPPLIVKKILDLIGYESNSHIADKLILDPACGMGAFVTEAVRRLRENLTIKFGYDPKRAEDSLQIINHVNSTIHGIEISEIAARSAMISYLFPLREEISTILKVNPSYRPDVSIYIFDALDYRFKPKADLDYIVGNPPYIQYSKLRSALREMYNRHFFTAKARYNVYGLFYEKSLSWLKNRGRLGFITSNRFFHTNYGKLLRTLLLSKTKIETIIDLKETTLFEQVETYPAIVIARKEKGQEIDWQFPYSYVETVGSNKSIDHEDWRDNLIIERLNFSVRQSRLSSEPWIFLPNNILSLFLKIQKQHIPLQYFCERISAGVATGANDVFLFNKKPKDIEEELLLPIIRGRDVNKNRIDWGGAYLLNPYELREGHIVPIRIDEFPGAKSYLERLKKRLISKYHAKHKEKWYETHDKVDSRIMTKRKIVFPDIAQENRFAIDEGRFLCLNTCYYIIHKSETELDFHNAILNSKLLEIIVKVKSPKLSQGHFRYMKRYIKDLPMVDPNEVEESTKKEIIDSVKEANWDQLDDIVYEIYGVPKRDKEEIRRILKFL